MEGRRSGIEFFLAVTRPFQQNIAIIECVAGVKQPIARKNAPSSKVQLLSMKIVEAWAEMAQQRFAIVVQIGSDDRHIAVAVPGTGESFKIQLVRGCVGYRFAPFSEKEKRS